MLFVIDTKTAEKFPSLKVQEIGEIRPKDVEPSSDLFLVMNQPKDLGTAAFLARAAEDEFVMLISAYTESKFVIEAELNHYPTEDIAHRINLIANNSISQKELQQVKEKENLVKFFTYDEVAHETPLPEHSNEQTE